MGGLENTKKTATEIQSAVVKGREMQVTTTKARNQYMPVASEASMLYFMIIQLSGVNHMYQYSLDSFLVFFNKALRSAKEEEDLEIRVENLRQELRLTIYRWIARGLFTKDTNILLSMLTFQLLRNGSVGSKNQASGDVGYREDMLVFLLLGKSKNELTGPPEENPLEWLPDTAWSSICGLTEIEEFANFSDDLIESAPRFREWFNHVSPETEKLPLDWRELDKTFFHKLLPIRALRPDRMLAALEMLQKQVLPNHESFLNLDAQLNSFQILEQIYEDSSPSTPIYFILSPGVDVISDVSKLARERDMIENETFHNISLGQGMDVVAEAKLLEGHKSGHWVMLNNVHLMPKWLTKLQTMLEDFAASEHGSHERFRLFLSSDPSTAVPIGILDCSIKCTNEAPSGIKANLKRAFRSFTPSDFEELDTRTRGILFGLCHFHAVMMERKTFGTKGFNMQYPFSSQDLQASAIVMRNYMENAGPKVPWLDLRYLIGEIMYGGHIVNDFDRTLCMCYLEYFLRDELLDEMEMFPYRDVDEVGAASFKAPPPTVYEKYLEHIDVVMVGDSPLAFGLHPNAEIDFRTNQCNDMLATIVSLQPNLTDNGSGEHSAQHAADAMLNDIIDAYSEVKFDMSDIRSNLETPGPFQNVFLQECETMNLLVVAMMKTLEELNLGFQGEMTMSTDMEILMSELALDVVPEIWRSKPYDFPSMRPLGSWLINLRSRIDQLQEWTLNPLEIPRVTWISGLFNPQRFLTAVLQTAAQMQMLELDKLMVSTLVLKREVEDIETNARDGAYIHGLHLEGARFDVQAGQLQSCKPKEMSFQMPVLQVKAIPASTAGGSNTFYCPVYKTQQRGPTFVFTANLRSRQPAAKWVLAGACMVMELV